MNNQVTQQEDCQITNTIVLIRPHKFRCNQMTIIDNHYQKSLINSDISKEALQEFDNFVSLLKKSGITTIVVQDEGVHDTPDSIFPNNWISFHHKHRYNIYPMFAQNRRLEKNIKVLQKLHQEQIQTSLSFDYSSFQAKNCFLEGTGSIIFDRKYKIAYAAISSRTNEQLFHKVCQDLNYKGCSFKAYQRVDNQRKQIYHTNVMMWIGESVVGICLKSIDDEAQRKHVFQLLKSTKREIIEYQEQQIDNFSGNALMLKGKDQNLIVMSSRAYTNLQKDQIKALQKHGRIIYENLQLIQTYGGGSARCMIAQIF